MYQYSLTWFINLFVNSIADRLVYNFIYFFIVLYHYNQYTLPNDCQLSHLNCMQEGSYGGCLAPVELLQNFCVTSSERSISLFNTTCSLKGLLGRTLLRSNIKRSQHKTKALPSDYYSNQFTLIMHAFRSL